MRTAEIPAVTLDEPAPVPVAPAADLSAGNARTALERHFTLLRWFSIPSPFPRTDERFAVVRVAPRSE